MQSTTILVTIATSYHLGYLRIFDGSRRYCEKVGINEGWKTRSQFHDGYPIDETTQT